MALMILMASARSISSAAGRLCGCGYAAAGRAVAMFVGGFGSAFVEPTKAFLKEGCRFDGALLDVDGVGVGNVRTTGESCWVGCFDFDSVFVDPAKTFLKEGCRLDGVLLGVKGVGIGSVKTAEEPYRVGCLDAGCCA